MTLREKLTNLIANLTDHHKLFKTLLQEKKEIKNILIPSKEKLRFLNPLKCLYRILRDFFNDWEDIAFINGIIF